MSPLSFANFASIYIHAAGPQAAARDLTCSQKHWHTHEPLLGGLVVLDMHALLELISASLAAAG